MSDFIPAKANVANESAQKIYLLCGSSANEVFCGTTRRRSLREALETCIHQKRIAYYGDPTKTISVPDQIRSLRSDFKTKDLDAITENILGGEVKVVPNGKVL